MLLHYENSLQKMIIIIIIAVQIYWAESLFQCCAKDACMHASRSVVSDSVSLSGL